MEAGTAVARGSRPTIGRLPRVRRQDAAFKYALLTVAGLILALIAFFFIRLYVEANPAFQKFGLFGFVFTNNWDVSREMFGALPLLVGTLITSAVALAIGVPVAVAAALFVTELCPRRLRAPLTIVLELLAAPRQFPGARPGCGAETDGRCQRSGNSSLHPSHGGAQVCTLQLSANQPVGPRTQQAPHHHGVNYVSALPPMHVPRS